MTLVPDIVGKKSRNQPSRCSHMLIVMHKQTRATVFHKLSFIQFFFKVSFFYLLYLFLVHLDIFGFFLCPVAQMF